MKVRTMKFKCNCGDSRCGTMRIDNLGNMYDFSFGEGKKKATQGVVIYEKDLERLKKFLNRKPPRTLSS